MRSGHERALFCALLISVLSRSLAFYDDLQEPKRGPLKRFFFGRYIWGTGQNARRFYDGGNDNAYLSGSSSTALQDPYEKSPRVRKAQLSKSNFAREFGFGKPFVYFGGFFRKP
ncbi:unnamed protein product [Toxocara canis]|nr:unnamed protein product [Toxocara canis]